MPAGLGSLPRQELPDDKPITGERQFVFVQGGKKIGYLQSATKRDADLFRTFMRCDRLLVERAHGPDAFLETKGGPHTAPDFEAVKSPR